MVTVSAHFHAACKSQLSKTRIRIYSIPESVNCTDDIDVVTNGTLLVANVGDTDSNARITEGGVKLSDYFNKDVDIEIGQTVSCHMTMTLMNDDGALDNFDYGKFKVYLDIREESDVTWQTASLGVFYFDKPTKRKVQLISVTARDQMQKLNTIATSWFNALDFENGISLQQILNSLVNECGIVADNETLTNLVNGDYTFTTAPLDAIELTYRDILGWIAGAAGGNARFDRNGFLTIRYFRYAMMATPSDDSAIVGYAKVGTSRVGSLGSNNPYFMFDLTAQGNGIFSVDIAEYTVKQISKLVVKSSREDYGTIVGSGTNAYELVDNPFLYGPTTADILGRAQNVYNAMSLTSFRPITMNVLANWAIEAGDIIMLDTADGMLVLPIFQQTIHWDGTFVRSTMMSSGSEERPVNSKQNRYEYRSNRTVHQLEVTAEELLSRITEDEQNYSQIQQTVDSISTTVSELNESMQVAQSDITQLFDSVTIGFNNTSDQFDAIYSFIRFIAKVSGKHEEGVVIGESTSDIKMKLENDILYFFTGDELSVDRSNAIAFFDTTRLNVYNATIQNITMGTDSAALDVRIMGEGDNICAFFGGRLQ